MYRCWPKQSRHRTGKNCEATEAILSASGANQGAFLQLFWGKPSVANWTGQYLLFSGFNAACWWGLTRPKQLSIAATARVVWLCACVRYWSDCGLVFKCVTCFYCCFNINPYNFLHSRCLYIVDRANNVFAPPCPFPWHVDVDRNW